MDRFEVKNEKDFIRLYKKKGYISSYKHKDGKLIDVDREIALNPNEIRVVAHHRFEALSNPSDISILYVIESDKGSKGTILVIRNRSVDDTLPKFFEEIPKDNISNDKSIL